MPGYASVERASEVLHLARRSVRDLIYAGRLPSLRVGRLHYIKSVDLDLERRRRLGLPLPQRPAARPHHAARRRSTTQDTLDAEVRRQRAAERAAQRAALVSRWALRHGSVEPRVPAVMVGVTTPVTCEACGRQVRRGGVVELAPEPGQPTAQLCVTCGRRALLDWADRRRLEAAAARRLSRSLGEPQPLAEPQSLGEPQADAPPHADTSSHSMTGFAA